MIYQKESTNGAGMTKLYTLTPAQYQRMLQPPHPSRIEQLQGNSYLPQHEVRAELSRTFGPANWDSQVLTMDLLYENEVTMANNRPGWKVAYRASVRLRIRDLDGNPVAEFEEYHAEEATLPSRGEAHATAVTSVESYALRRCAIGLGDNFGLCLYAKGSTKPLIVGSIAYMPTAPNPAPSPDSVMAPDGSTEVSIADAEAAGYDPIGLDGGDK